MLNTKIRVNYFILVITVIVLVAIYYFAIPFYFQSPSTPSPQPSSTPSPPPPSFYKTLKSQKYNQYCDDWFDEYAQFHRKQRDLIKKTEKNEVNPKILVWRCLDVDECGGISDRFSTIISSFLFAILHNRVLLIEWPNLEKILMSPFINWTKPEGLESLNYSSTIYNTGSNVLFHSENSFPEDIVYWRWVAGGTSGLFESPYSQMAMKKGFPVFHTAGCILNALFRPTQLLEDQFSPELAQIFQNTSKISKIGIHFRTGDHSFISNIPQPTEKYDHIWKQVQEVEDRILSKKGPGHIVKWFLIGDSKSVVENAQKRFGDKIITSNIHPRHISSSEGGRKKGDVPFSVLLESFFDWWLLSMCDEFVSQHLFDETSGYFRSSVIYGLPKETVYPCMNGDTCMTQQKFISLGSGL